MAILINGEIIPDALVDLEYERLLKTQKAGNPDPARLRLMAACAAVDQVLIRQAAERDPRPADPSELDALVRHGAKPAIAEQQLRLQRTMDELAGDFPKPTPEEVLAFYQSIKDRLAPAEKAHAAHILVRVSDQRSEAEARRLIEAARVSTAAAVAGSGRR